MVPDTHELPAQRSAAERRRTRLIVPRFQLGLVAAFGAIAFLGLLLEVLLVAVQLGALEQRMPSGGAYVAEAVPRMIGSSLGLSLLLVLPALLVIGVRLTFRWAGPVYRIKKHCEAIARGEDPGPLRLRSGDELQDLADAVEAAVVRLNAERRDDGAREAA